MSDVPVAPKSRRWWVGLLLLLIAVGGGVWWRTRLTPEEQILMGRWRNLEPSPNGGPIIESVIEFRRNRRVFKNGVPWDWSARNGQFTAREPQLERLYTRWAYSGFIPSWSNESLHGRIQVIDHDTVNITLRDSGTGQDAITMELKRIVEE